LKNTHIPVEGIGQVAATALGLLCIATNAFAQAQGQGLGQVADPAAAVPPVVYESVFTDIPKGVETQTIDWKKANADVGQFTRGHVDILKWEEAQSAKPVPKPQQAPMQPTAPTMHKH
jgi:hypothetical protein